MSFFYHKKSMRIAMVILGLFGIVMSGSIIIMDQYSLLDAFIIITGIYAFAEAFLKKVSVDSEGVSYSFLNKKYFLKWNDVKYVEVIDMGSRKRPNNALYFSTKSVNASAITPKNISNNFILTLNSGEGIVDEVKKYWNGTISGLEHLN